MKIAVEVGEILEFDTTKCDNWYICSANVSRKARGSFMKIV